VLNIVDLLDAIDVIRASKRDVGARLGP